MELIIAICFFAVTSAVCAQIFAKSHILSTRTTQLGHAVAQAESAAESFRALNGDLEALADLFPGSQLSGDTLTIYYDSQWQPTGADETASSSSQKPAPDMDTPAAPTGNAGSGATYTLTLTRTPDTGHCVNGHIELAKSGDTAIIYSLDVSKFVKGR